MTASTLHRCNFCTKDQLRVSKLISGNDVYICDECIDLCHDILHREQPITDEEKAQTLTPKKIKEYLDERVIGQDFAKTILSVSIYNHHKRINNPIVDGVEIDKSNLMFIGSSGVGKTYIIQNITQLLKIPMVIVDATSLTESGYVGLDVEDCLVRLYHAADQDIEAAQRGIIYIDEIDKKSRKGENVSISRDVSGEGVQQALLKLIEGSECKVPTQGGRKNPNGEYVTINTKNILFIVGGAFVGLDNIIDKRTNESNSSIGFSAKLKDSDSLSNSFELFRQAQSEDLVKFGIIPELIGRLPIIVPFQDLGEPELIRILTEPKNSIIKQFQKMFKLDKVELEFNNQSLTAIARLANKRKTGARGLRSIIEDILLPIQFELPDFSTNNVEKIIITEEVVNNSGLPIMVYRKETVAQ